MTLLRYDAIVFDLDGVLVHTDQSHYRAWKKLADELGIPFDETINNRLRGVGRRESLEIILERSTVDYTDAQKQAFTDQKNTYYRAGLQQLSPNDLTDDVRQTLDGVKRLGLKTAIASSSKNTRFILERLGLDGFFDAVSDGTNITRSKPDPEVYNKAAAFLAMPADRCLAVEDARSGIESALAAGMDCAAVGDGTRYNIATYDLHNLSDLLSILKS